MNETTKILVIIAMLAVIWFAVQSAKHAYPDHRRVLDMLTVFLVIADFIIVIMLLVMQKESNQVIEEHFRTKKGAPFP